MKFIYTRRDLNPQEKRLEKFLSVLPAFISWNSLIWLLVLCIFVPVAGVAGIILFNLYWLFRLVYFTIFLVLSYAILKIEKAALWHERLEDLTAPKQAIKKLEEQIRGLQPFRNWKKYFSQKRHLATLKRLAKNSIRFPEPSEIHQLVIIPFFQEGMGVLEATLQALGRVDFPFERMVVVLAVEERAGRKAREMAEQLKKQFGKTFHHFEISVHPEDVPGEAAVKGANATHAARWAKDYFDTRKISFDRILVSCFDADTVVSPEYFSCLTYNYLIHPNRTRTSFQPIPVYHNNLWDAPSFARVLETGSSFMQLIEASDPDQLVTFSSHSMSFQALVEVGYWPLDLISDDSAIFWKAFLYYDGDYRVEPLYVTLSMDVALGDNLWETCQSIYQQKRRWAWGIENFPILVRGFLANSRIPLWIKFKHTVRLLEMNVSWAIWTPIMLILSWAPFFVVNREFMTTVAHFNAPRVTGVIFNLAFVSLVISIILSFSLLPKRPQKVPIFQKLIFGLQWLLVPLIATVFGAIPALDAQTRLALGKYMEFFVSPKGRRKKQKGPGPF